MQVSSTSVSHSSLHIQLPHPITLQHNICATALNSKGVNFGCNNSQHQNFITLHIFPMNSCILIEFMPWPSSSLQWISSSTYSWNSCASQLTLCALNNNTTNAEIPRLPNSRNFSCANSRLHNPSNPGIQRLPHTKEFSHANSKLHHPSNPKIQRLPYTKEFSHANSKNQHPSNPEIQRLPHTSEFFHTNSQFHNPSNAEILRIPHAPPNLPEQILCIHCPGMQFTTNPMDFGTPTKPHNGSTHISIPW